MTRRRKKRARSRVINSNHTPAITVVAIGGVTLFALTIICTNVIGWPQLIPGPLGKIASVLAIGCGVLAFSLWEHVRHFFKNGRWWNFWGAFLIFGVCCAVDAVGVHSGIDTLAKPWRETLAEQANTAHTEAQRKRTVDRGELQAEIDRLQGRIDAAAPSPRGGPITTEEDRETWQARTGNDQSRLARKQAELDALPREVEREPVAPWLTQAIWAFSIFAEFIVAFGLSILGVEVTPRFPEKEEPEPVPEPVEVEVEVLPPLPANVSRLPSPPVRRRQRPATGGSGRDMLGYFDED